MEKREEEKGRPSLEDDDDGGGDEQVGAESTVASSPPLFAAHPCTVLQYIVRACAGCLLGLCGGGPDGDGPQPGGAADAVDPGATTQREPEESNKVMTVEGIWQALKCLLQEGLQGGPVAQEKGEVAAVVHTTSKPAGQA
ncbi:hypothetical protein ACP70R_003412 [Stipagrostis hirtigluma subsp. patula]